jgi:hypothetical protein
VKATALLSRQEPCEEVVDRLEAILLELKRLPLPESRIGAAGPAAAQNNEEERWSGRKQVRMRRLPQRSSASAISTCERRPVQ